MNHFWALYICCSNSCARSGDRNPMFGRTGNKSGTYKGDYYSNNIPFYDTYASQLKPYEQYKRNNDDPNILEVRCAYCGKWYIPTINEVNNRIIGINGSDWYRFYCSDNCKSVCPLYRKTSEQLIKRDKIAAGIILPEELNREIQSDLRKMVLARDNYTCQICGKGGPLHCHHIDPITNNPIESADIDNCITLCIECHKYVHKLPGCTYNELRRCANEQTLCV
jgi:5-methylcytosine-specific restriction endonuclease McrA